MKQRCIRAGRVALALVLVMALFATSALAASMYAKINTKTKIYRSPSKSSQSATVKKNVKVKVLDESDGWAKVYKDGVTAYIPSKYLNLTSPVKAYTTTSTTVYKKAGSSRAGTLPAGTLVYVVGYSGKYSRVKASKSSANTYYIRSNNLTRNKVYVATGTTDSDSGAGSVAYSGSNGTSTRLSDIPALYRASASDALTSDIEMTIYIAQNQLGAPYNTHSDPPRSFDCATFTRYCYNTVKSGAVLSSSKSQGYDTRYSRIMSTSSLKRGDLMCFDTEVDSVLCDHVGIYLGGGYFIHASSTAKAVVQSNFYDNTYYQKVFSWALRVFNN